MFPRQGFCWFPCEAEIDKNASRTLDAQLAKTVRPRKTEDWGMTRQKAVVNSLSTLVLYQNSLKK